MDTDSNTVSAHELLQQGLMNMWEEGKEGAYAVRRGTKPVRDYPVAEDSEGNFFEKAFPCLFPYGEGGIERQRRVPVGFTENVRWALQYWDRRFRVHETFPFVAFGIAQRRQALNSARVQLKRRTFERDAHIMSTITVDQLRKAAEEENAHLPLSNAAVRLLRSHVHAISGRVQGSDQARYQVRSQIWSTAVMLGPPTLWMTINPADINDPIAQVFAGEDINLDNFIALAGPDKDRRAKNIADDPYAAAKFFHFMISTIVETLFGIKVTKYQVKSTMGVLGEVAAYIGLDEVQARGMIHWHALITLRHSPSADEILQLLKTQEFRSKVTAYIAANIRAYLPGFESAASVKVLPRESEIAYNRPPHPYSGTYEAELLEFERRVARLEQLHTCRLRRCLVFDKKGQLRCKRRAPFQCSADAFVDENGSWCPKRLYAYMNGWNPSVLINARCNNDLKILTNGGDARNITFYVTSYATKKQAKTHSLSAIMAKGYNYHLNHPNRDYLDHIRDNQRLLFFQLVHAISREQELSGPLVISYLMGWGDVQRSHTYSPIHWSFFFFWEPRLFATM
jgi:hypothetical protein